MSLNKPTAMFNFQLDYDVLKRLEALSKMENTSTSAVIRDAIKYYLDNL